MGRREEQGSGRERLCSFLRRYAEINMDDFGRCVIRTGDELLSEDGRTRFRKLKRDIDCALRSVIAEAIADGSIAAGDPEAVGFHLAGRSAGRRAGTIRKAPKQRKWSISWRRASRVAKPGIMATGRD